MFMLLEELILILLLLKWFLYWLRSKSVKIKFVILTDVLGNFFAYLLVSVDLRV